MIKFVMDLLEIYGSPVPGSYARADAAIDSWILSGSLTPADAHSLRAVNLELSHLVPVPGQRSGV